MSVSVPLNVWAAPLSFRQVGRTSTVSPGSSTWLPAASKASAAGRRPPKRWA